MKKYLFLAFIFTACTNNTTVTKEAENSNSNKVEKEEIAAASTGPVNCNNLVFFKQGAEITAKSYDAAGKETSTQLTKIIALKNENGMTVATVKGSDTTPEGKVTNVTYNYKCDGRAIYFDVASLFRTAEKESDATFESSLIEYPISLTEGESLPDVTGSMSSEKRGKKMTMNYHYINRKVGAKETITTPAGTWNCYKISNEVKVEMDIPGMDEKAKKMMEAMQGQMKTTSITWFASDFGIVKMEMYQNGKLVSINEVTRVKQ